MKKLFSMIAALLFAGSMMAAVGNVFYTLEFLKTDGNSAYASYFDITSNGMQWNAPGNMTQGDFDRIGGNSLSKQARYVTAKSTMGDAISRIIITHNGGNRKEVILDSITVTVASDANFTEDVVVEQYAQHLGNGSAKIAAGTITLDPTATNWAKDSYYKVTFFITNSSSSNGGLDVVSLAFYSYQDPNAPAINAANVQLDAGLTKDGNYSTTAELVVTGANLTDAITVTDGTYTTAEGTLTAAGGTLQLTFIVSAEGEYADHITLTSGSTSVEVPVTAKVIQTTGIGTKTDPLTVADVIKINNATSLSNKYWVAGYIVGSAKNGGLIDATDAATNFALGATADQTENVLPVELPSGTIRTALNIVDNPSNKGKQIKVHGVLQMYFNFTGVKSVDDYEFIEAAPAPEIALSETALAFGSFQKDTETSGYNKVVLKSFDITAANLTAPITLDLLGNGYRIIAPGYPNGLVSLTINPTAGAIDTTITISAYTGLVGDFTGSVTISSTAATADFTAIVLPLSVTITEPLTYELKNAWDGGEWTWKEMTRVNNDQHKLEGVVFGGGGVNWRTVGETTDGTWIPVGDFQGDNIDILDTIDVTFTPSTTSIYVQIVGKYVAPADPTWTVAGSSDDAFGSSWDPSNTDNDMVKQSDGTFLWEKENITLGAGTINFKVCRDHDWVIAYPATDYSLNIAADGIYTITITFDPSSHEVTAVATKTGDAVVIPTIALHGNFTGSWADTELFTLAANEETATLTLALTAGDYEFGMRIGGSGNWTSNGAAFTRTNPSAVVAAGSGNLTIAADVDGDYVFTWTYATNTLSVEFPAAAPAGNDWCGVEVWHFYGANPDGDPNSYALLSIADNQDGTITFTISQDAAKNTNTFDFLLINPIGATAGTDVAESDATSISATYTVPDGVTSLTLEILWSTPDWPGRWMLQNLVVDLVNDTFCAPVDPTSISNTQAVEKAVKFIENGQLFIIKNGVKYNATGAVVR